MLSRCDVLGQSATHTGCLVYKLTPPHAGVGFFKPLDLSCPEELDAQIWSADETHSDVSLLYFLADLGSQGLTE